MTDLPGILLLSIRILIVILLYLFLALSIRVLWLNMKTNTGKDHASFQIPPLHFSITRPDSPTLKYVLEAPEATLGRGPDNTFQIKEDTVSSRHARLFYESSQWWIQDMGSSNGTLLNSIALTQASILTSEDQIQLGKVTLGIIRTIASPPFKPQPGDVNE